jgi:hypothetical protein
MRNVLASLLLLALPAFSAQAADTKTAPPSNGQSFSCPGEVWVVRKSKIVPGGSLAGFMKAVADQTAWYRANGITTSDERVGRVFVYNSDTHERKLVEDEVVTFHMAQPQAEKRPRGDAKWDAYVAEYKANSKLIDETEVCMAPKA